MAIRIRATLELSGFSELLESIDNGIEKALDVYADEAIKLLKSPTEKFDSNVSFNIISRRKFRDAGSSTKRYVDISEGFKHKTAFNKDFRPKTRPRSLVSFEGAGQAFPNRRREAVRSEPRNFDDTAYDLLIRDVNTLSRAKEALRRTINGR